jgi:hypothetical protein
MQDTNRDKGTLINVSCFRPVNGYTSNMYEKLQADCKICQKRFWSKVLWLFFKVPVFSWKS